MDAEMTRAQGVEAEEDHPEKTSILKRVKAKAKKVKSTIASKAHVGHGPEHESSQDDEDDEHDEDDAELGPDPEVHGAPSAGNSGMGPDINLTRAGAGPTPAPSENVCPGTFQAKVTDSGVPAASGSAYNSVAPWDSSLNHDAKSGQFKGETFKHTDVPTGTVGEDTDVLKHRQEDLSPVVPHAIEINNPVPTHEPASPKRHGAGQDENSGFFKGPPLDEPSLEDVSPANLQANGSDYGGNVVGGHAGASPTDVSVTPILQSFDKMAIHDEPQQPRKESVTAGSRDQSSPSPVPDRQFIPESFGSMADQGHPQDMNVDQSNTQQGGYTSKVSSVASAIAGKAIAAKNVVASKVGYGGNDDNPASQDVNMSGREPSKPQATSAKNVVASKLGYGGTDDSVARERPEINKEGDTANEQAGGGVTGYGRQMASTVTEKLAPVYGTVAGAGSAVLSKIPGTGMGTQQKTGDSAKETSTGSVRETDKGGVGMKGYIAEKLKPSDEDKALSEVISGALQKRGNTVEAEKKDMVGAHDGEDMDREKMNVPMGRVTESEEVANRLGSSEEERTGKVYPGTGNESPSTGVVDKVKGALTNWFGKGGEMNPSMAFNDQNNQSQGSTGEVEKAPS